jgi:L-2-hydroxyglutarate oxidase LhgO
MRGIRLMLAFARRHNIAHEQCGKLVVAGHQDQVAELRRLLQQGTANGLKGLRWLNGDEAQAVEPYVRAVAAIRVPEEGIIDYRMVVDVLRREVEALGAQVIPGTRVERAARRNGRWIVSGGKLELQADFVVNCAGLQCDRVARVFGARPSTAIIPFRGEYFMLERTNLVRHLIYPVADSRMPFLGVHFTRMVHGGVECGPNAVLALDREGYKRLAFNARDAGDALTSLRLWRFIARYAGATLFEIRRSLSKAIFLKSLQDLVPEVQGSDLRPGPVGIRAQAIHRNGRLVTDFEFLEQAGALHVLNAPSPAATASLAIGEVVAQRVARQIEYDLEQPTIDL